MVALTMTTYSSSSASQAGRYYAPTPTDLMVIRTGLRGGSDAQCAFLSPAILPSPLPWLTDLQQYLTQPDAKAIPRSLSDCLARHHVALFNHYILCKSLVLEMHPYLDLDAGQQAMQSQLAVLHHEYQELHTFLTTNFSLQAPFIHFVTYWVAATSPVIMMMGYPDAMAHAGQVSRLCVVKAAEMSHNPLELMQAALVGWLHDPKLLPTFSLDNLCTHPVIAATIAEDIFQERSAQDALQQVITHIESLNPPSNSTWEMTPHHIAQGVIEALAINNDSRYVMERFVLPKLELQIQKMAFEEQHDPKTTEHTLNLLEQVTRSRLSGPSQGRPIPSLPNEVLHLLHATSMDTGLVGLHTERWSEICATVIPDTDPMTVYKHIINGEWGHRQTDIIQLHEALETASRKDKSAYLYWPVSSPTLFHHHEEVCPSGKIAALALACSDPLLLSPHKVITTRPDNEILLKRVASYLDSLSDNIQDLPMTHQTSSRSWQRAVLLWLLASAEALTRGNLVHPFLDSHQMSLPETDIADLDKILRQAGTWGIFANLSTQQENNQPVMDQAINTIQHYYSQLCVSYRNAVMDHDVDESKLAPQKSVN